MNGLLKRMTPPFQWCVNGVKYTPSTLPGRFVSNLSGLAIYGVVNEDNGTLIQCFLDLVDINVHPISVVRINSPVAVLYVLQSVLSLKTTLMPSPSLLSSSSQLLARTLLNETNSTVFTLPLYSSTPDIHHIKHSFVDIIVLVVSIIVAISMLFLVSIASYVILSISSRKSTGKNLRSVK